MPKNLKRIIGRGDLHFITFCCYQRRTLLASTRARDLAVQILKGARARYGFALVGYVIMPEHFHVLISESASVSPSKIIQVFKRWCFYYRGEGVMRVVSDERGENMLRFSG